MGQFEFGQKIIPVAVDRDSDPKNIEVDKGFVRYMINCRRGNIGSGSDVVENIPGNILIPNVALPAGVNRNIGSIEDRRNRRLVFFNYNSTGQHGIYLYIPDDLGQKIYPLMIDPVLDFSEVMEIDETKAVIVDGKYLVWTDNYNSQRFLDIEKALMRDKKRKWEFQQYTETERFSVSFRAPATVFVSNLTVADLESNSRISEHFTVEVCDCKVFFEEKVPGAVSNFTISTGRLMPVNFYPTTANERQIDYILWPASTGPEVRLKYDDKFRRNLISGQTWQFRVKYNYKGGFPSVWSPWSKAIAVAEDVSQLFNYIEVDYTAKIFNELNLEDHLAMIESVEIGYRNTNEGKLHRFITIPQCEIPKTRQAVRFYNDVFAQATGDVADAKQYDTVPLKSGALTLARDRVVMGDNTENYEVDCVDYKLNVQFTPTKKLQTGTVSGRVYIHNYVSLRKNFEREYVTAQPIGIYSGNMPVFGGMNGQFAGEGDWIDASEHQQFLPDGGFYVYLVGTEHYAKTKQIRISGVEYYDDDNNIIDLKSKDNRNKLRNYIDGGGKIYSEFKIENVPAGKYIIAVASHWCSATDKLGRGDYYKVDSSLKFQKTSTYVCNMQPDGSVRYNSDDKLNGIKQDIIEVLPDADTRTKDIVIEDLTCPAKGANTSSRSISGYVIDAGGVKVTQTDLKSGTTIEGALMRWDPNKRNYGDDVNLTCRTDHNGFFYAAHINGKVASSNGKDGKILVSIGSKMITKERKRVYQGTLNELYNGTLDAQENIDINFDENSHHNFIIPNTDTHVATKLVTKLTGVIKTADGVPLKGLQVVVSGTNRVVRSEQDGAFSVLIYRPYDLLSRSGTLLVYDRNGSLTLDVTERTFVVFPFESTYTIDNPYRISDIIIPISNLDKLNFYLKAGGVYDFGLTFCDRALRKTLTQFNEDKGRLRIPFITEKVRDYFPELTVDTNGDPITADTKADGYFSVSITMGDRPPVWSTHALVERTQDQVYSDYIQFVVSNVKYIEKYDSTTEEGVETTYGSSTANEIYLDLGTSFSQYQDRNSSSQKGWAFAKGDRIRFIYKKDGTPRDFYEAEVKDQRGNYFVIDNIGSLGQIEPGEIVEIFRLKTTVQEGAATFYETGEFFKVLNSYTGARAWESNTVSLNTGDAYRRIRKMYQVKVDGDTETLMAIYRSTIEDPSPYDSILGKDNDIGRPDLENENTKQVRRMGAIRFSGKYALDGAMNGLRSMNAEDVVESNQDYGPISIIADFEDLLFVAQQRKCHTRLIQKSIVQLGDGGQNIIANPNRFLDQPYYLEKENGCINPESFARSNNTAKFFDALSGEVCQYSRQNGLVNISGFDNRYNSSKLMDNVFKVLPQVLRQLDPEYLKYHFKAYGVYDETNMEYTLSIKDVVYSGSAPRVKFGGSGPNIGDNDPQFGDYPVRENVGSLQAKYASITTVFTDKTTYWLGGRSYNPERYGQVAKGYVMFQDGQLWHAELNSLYGNFFGIQTAQTISVVMNREPSMVKDFLAWSLETDTNWEVFNVEVPLNKSLMRRQVSRVPQSMNEGYERGYFGQILKDETTPNTAFPLHEGNDMAGETLLFEIRNSESAKTQLFAINIYGQLVPRTGY